MMTVAVVMTAGTTTATGMTAAAIAIATNQEPVPAEKSEN